MKKLALLLVLLLLNPGGPKGFAQTPVWTVPQPVSSLNGNVSSTITSTNTFQLVFATAVNTFAPVVGNAGPRKGCSIQNNGTNSMWVSEGKTIATATKATSWVIVAGGLFNCNFNNVVLTGEIDITGTSGDAFYASQF